MSDAAAYHILRAHENKLAILRNGNGDRAYQITLTGREVYHLLGLLEKLAVESDVYLVVKDAVGLAEVIRAQAEKQGFGKPE